MRTALTTFLLLATSALPAWSQVKIEAIVESASFQPGLPAGGALATIFLSGFTDRSRIKPGIYVASSPLPYELAGFSVNINVGGASPILAVIVTSVGETMKVQI